jgi:hypothetical protein
MIDRARRLNDRKLFIGLAMVLFIVVLSLNVSALGITPGRTTFDYESGASGTVEFTVVNSENVDMELVVLVQGELNESVSVSEVSFHMDATEKSKTLSYTVTMPPDLKPGLNSAEVVVIQLPGKSKTSEAFIGAALGVATQIYINVPFPGKYAEADMNVIGPDDGGTVTFVIPVHSKGDLDLVRVRGTIDIFGPLNEKVASVTTNEISLISQERKEIVATWDALDVAPGPYRAVATVLYDEQTLTIESQFSVGKRLLELANIEVNDFSLGDIAKFEVLVENKWSQSIVGAYAQMLIYNSEGDVMADFKSATYDLPPLEKALMVAFWDTGGVRKGTYDSSLFLKYGERSEQQDLKLEVKDSEINIVGIGYVISKSPGGGGLGGNTLTIVLITVIVVLVLINLLWFLVLRKKLKGNK